jgi:hypothetical protein
MEKLFIGANLGFNLLSMDGEEASADYGGFAGFTIGLKAGWKLKFTPKFFMEPSLAYVYAKTGVFGVPTPLGWQPSLNIGIAL